MNCHFWNNLKLSHMKLVNTANAIERSRIFGTVQMVLDKNSLATLKRLLNVTVTFINKLLKMHMCNDYYICNNY